MYLNIDNAYENSVSAARFPVEVAFLFYIQLKGCELHSRSSSFYT